MRLCLVKRDSRAMLCWTNITLRMHLRTTQHAYSLFVRIYVFLWPPYIIGQAIIFLPCGFYFLLLSIFFPRLISAATDWMSTILLHIWRGPSANLECMSEMYCTRLAANTGGKKVAKNRHLGTIAQLRRAISSQLRHVSTIQKTC